MNLIDIHGGHIALEHVNEILDGELTIFLSMKVLLNQFQMLTFMKMSWGLIIAQSQ
jgi:hypothetical protein